MWTALAVLLFSFTSNQCSRQLIYYLCNFSPTTSSPFLHINIDLAFSQEQYGLLASVGFTTLFALTSLFAGSFSDSFSRKKIILFSSLGWSFITILQSFSYDYTSFLVLRSLLAIVQAFFTPAAYTLLSDIFPKKLVGTANGVLGGGVYIGGGLASLSILLDNQIGWRSTFLSVGVAGVLISAFLFFFVNEPRVENTPKIEQKIAEEDDFSVKMPLSTSYSSSVVNFSSQLSSYTDAVKEVLESPGARTLLLASALRFAAGFTLAIWKAPFVFSKFPGSEALFASSNAAVVAVGGLASSLLGGYLSDLIQKTQKEGSKARVWVAAIGSLAAAPLWAGFILAETPSLAVAYLFAEYIAAECWIGPTLAGLYDVIPTSRRGTAQGMFSFLTAIGNVAPLLVGFLVGGSNGGGAGEGVALGNVLIGTISGSYFISGLLFLWFIYLKPGVFGTGPDRG